jgi:hypothetical protein
MEIEYDAMIRRHAAERAQTKREALAMLPDLTPTQLRRVIQVTLEYPAEDFAMAVLCGAIEGFYMHNREGDPRHV